MPSCSEIPPLQALLVPWVKWMQLLSQAGKDPSFTKFLVCHISALQMTCSSDQEPEYVGIPNKEGVWYLEWNEPSSADYGKFW